MAAILDLANVATEEVPALSPLLNSLSWSWATSGPNLVLIRLISTKGRELLLNYYPYRQLCQLKLITLIMKIAQHMQASIRLFLNAGDPYSTFIT